MWTNVCLFALGCAAHLPVLLPLMAVAVLGLFALAGALSRAERRAETPPVRREAMDRFRDTYATEAAPPHHRYLA